MLVEQNLAVLRSFYNEGYSGTAYEIRQTVARLKVFLESLNSLYASYSSLHREAEASFSLIDDDRLKEAGDIREEMFNLLMELLQLE